MTDIVERLRAWVYTDSQYATALEAADEIERLRSRPCPYVTGRTTQYCTLPTTSLTPEERESVAYYLGTGGPDGVDRTLVALLSRTGSDAAKQGDNAAECRKHGEKTPERDRLPDAGAALIYERPIYRRYTPVPPDKEDMLTDAEREALTEASGLYIGTRTGLELSCLLERLGGAK